MTFNQVLEAYGHLPLVFNHYDHTAFNFQSEADAPVRIEAVVTPLDLETYEVPGRLTLQQLAETPASVYVLTTVGPMQMFEGEIGVRLPSARPSLRLVSSQA